MLAYFPIRHDIEGIRTRICRLKSVHPINCGGIFQYIEDDQADMEQQAKIEPKI